MIEQAGATVLENATLTFPNYLVGNLKHNSSSIHVESFAAFFFNNLVFPFTLSCTRLQIWSECGRNKFIPRNSTPALFFVIRWLINLHKVEIQTILLQKFYLAHFLHVSIQSAEIKNK